MSAFKSPTNKKIDEIAKNFRNDSYEISRFTTGLCHYVYDVRGSQSRFVVRVSNPDNINRLKGNLFWTKELENKSLPLAEILKLSIENEEYSYMIIEHIDGVDLGEVIDTLSYNEIERVVKALIKYDEIAENLPLGNGFGWGLNYSCSQLTKNWNNIIDGSISKAKGWINSVDKVDPSIVTKVEKLKSQFSKYLGKVQPKAYFHDLTTKNLLLSPASKSIVGFVDIDEMGFGDKFFHLSLMKMALFANGHSDKLLDVWLNKLSATSQQIAILDFYTLLHCIMFMGENGNAFNKDEAVFDEEYHNKLNS